MKRSASSSFALVAAVTWCLGTAGCAEEPRAETEGSAAATVASEAVAEQAADDGAGERATVEASEGSEGEHGRSEGSEGEGEGEHGGSEGRGEQGEESEGGEHDSGGEGEEGEESGVYIGKGDTWDAVRRGARLALTFDAGSGAFIGTVHNRTDRTLCAIRVEVHLSTGTELGPTARTDVPAGGVTDVTLSAAGEEFESWTAHPEMSACST